MYVYQKYLHSQNILFLKKLDNKSKKLNSVLQFFNLYSNAFSVIMKLPKNIKYCR